MRINNTYSGAYVTSSVFYIISELIGLGSRNSWVQSYDWEVG